MAEVTCPHCGDLMEAEVGLVICPHCGEQVEVVTQQEDEELDGNRIQRIAHARRSEVRARAYQVIGGLALLGGSGQVVWMGVHAARAAGWGMWAVGCMALGAAGVLFSIWLLAKSK